MPAASRILPLTQVPKEPGYQWLTVSQLRHLRFEAEALQDAKGNVVVPANGLASAIIKIGRKVLLDLDEFDRWLLSHRIGPK